jgi:ACT domain-containing protein
LRAVITVTGKDSKGIIAKVSGECFKYGVNILDITQSVLQDFFAMSMLVDITDITSDFNDFVDLMTKLGEDNALKIYTMHEDIFNSMHSI